MAVGYIVGSRVTGEWWIAKDLKENICGLSELRRIIFPEETKENHYKQQAGYQVFRPRWESVLKLIMGSFLLYTTLLFSL